MTTVLLQVFTHRQGLAARLGHDLRISTPSARLTLSEGRLEVRVDLRTLEVDGAMRHGQLDAATLSASDRDSIARAMHDAVLESDRHTEAVFTGTTRFEGERVLVSGELALKGRSHALSMHLARTGRRVAGQTTLQPSQWGIRPYAALGGALKVSDRVEVYAELTLDADLPWPPAKV